MPCFVSIVRYSIFVCCKADSFVILNRLLRCVKLGCFITTISPFNQLSWFHRHVFTLIQSRSIQETAVAQHNSIVGDNVTRVNRKQNGCDYGNNTVTDSQICRFKVKQLFYWNLCHLETMHHAAFYKVCLFDFINQIIIKRGYDV